MIELLSEECGADLTGKELTTQRLLEILLVEALRWDNIGNNTASAGLLNGLRDPAMACILRAIHKDVRRRWTVADLAGIAGMSESGFAERFREILGFAPIEYVARWRIAIAKQALLRGEKSLDRIADNRLRIRQHIQQSVQQKARLLAAQVCQKARRQWQPWHACGLMMLHMLTAQP